MLKYADAKAVISIKRPKVIEDATEMAHIMKDWCELTTWKGDTIEKILEATGLKHTMEPGDLIQITIEIGKQAVL
jgi:hypothetical protein